MGVHVDFEMDGEMGAHVATVTGEGGDYVDPAEYLQDLIRRDMEAVNAHRFRTVKEHLQHACATPESEYVEVDINEFLQRMRSSAG